MTLRQQMLLLCVFFWFLLILLCTHYGSNSPYSYGWTYFGHSMTAKIDNASVNPDALTVIPLTDFFYDPIKTKITAAPNINLPLHSFLAATTMGIFHSYMFSNSLLNILLLTLVSFMLIRLAAEARFGFWPTLIAGLTALSLPYFTHYLAQPMQYIVGSCLNFIVIITAFNLKEEDSKNPIIWAILFAVLLLNYDSYIYLASVVIFCLIKNIKQWDYKEYLQVGCLAFIPILLWQLLQESYLHQGNAQNLEQFFHAISDGWVSIFRPPLFHIFQPFIVSHVGVSVALNQLLAYFPWPLVVILVISLCKYFDELTKTSFWQLGVIVFSVYLLEQIFTAGFDWENNPRRAIPIILVFTIFYTWIVNRVFYSTLGSFKVKSFFVTLLICMIALLFADTFLHYGVYQMLEVGQVIRGSVKELVMNMLNYQLVANEFTGAVSSAQFQWVTHAKASWQIDKAAVFLCSQLIMLSVITSLIWVMIRANLVPRISMLGFTSFYAFSLILRFV